MFSAATEVANDVSKGATSSVVDKMNRIFFGGGALDPKHIDFIVSDSMPLFEAKILTNQDLPLQKANFKVINVKQNSSFHLWGYLEAIPVLGSVLGFFALIGHQFKKRSIERSLRLAVKEMDNDGDEKMKLAAATRVLTLAAQYTQNHNQRIGSLLALVPLVKPIVRIRQVAIPIINLKKANQDDF